MEPYVWTIAHTMVEALFNAGHKEVIVDATHPTLERRKQWFKPAQWDLAFKVIDTNVETCLERAEENGQDYLLNFIKAMASVLELPEEWEGEIL
jgi:predicted kinase